MSMFLRKVGSVLWRTQQFPLVSFAGVNHRTATFMGTLFQRYNSSGPFPATASNPRFQNNGLSLVKLINYSVRRRISTEAPHTSTVAVKKRSKRKAGGSLSQTELSQAEDTDAEVSCNAYPVVAYATCDEIHLEKLKTALVYQGLYVPTVWKEDCGTAYAYLNVFQAYLVLMLGFFMDFFKTQLFWT